MYVITFYSFKGGVGRSMALANTAFELAQTGRRVLIVDFDLEAPGLLDYEIEKPEDLPGGVIEFVTDYLNTGIVPDAMDYIFESTAFPETGGKIFVMPAGRIDNTYQARFGQVNWAEFYAERDGYVVMEDLRAQWQDRNDFDYVLIDSRTGYTDIAGICTRQLPDAVCLVFTPNLQNLSGIKRIYSEIIAQKAIPQLRQPKVHFLASNVPNLGDDNPKVESVLRRYQSELDSCTLSGTVYHHDSFALLEQEIFTYKYPSSNLAAEYRVLVRNITKENFNDKVVVMQFLQDSISRISTSGNNWSASELDDKLNQILTNFSMDSDVILGCARLKRYIGDVEQHRELLEVAIERGTKVPRAYLELAAYQEGENSGDDAWENVQRSLKINERVSPPDLTMAIRLGVRLFGEKLDLDVYVNSKSVRNMSPTDIIFVCTSIDDNTTCARLSVRLLTELFNWRSYPELFEQAATLLANAFIALGRLGEAKDVLTPLYHSGKYKIIHGFNLGMACFWSEKIEDRELAIGYFKVVLAALATDDDLSPNKTQCMAFIYWALGHRSEAESKLLELRRMIEESSSVRFFSCWRYHYASRRQAAEDVEDMQRLFAGENLVPKFLRYMSEDLF
jgi:cellulose biosynthesis protein BcsQ